MEREAAEKVIESAILAGKYLDQIFVLSDAIQDQSEKTAFRKSIGEILGALYTDIMMPVIAKYPELDPDK